MYLYQAWQKHVLPVYIQRNSNSEEIELPAEGSSSSGKAKQS